MNNKYRIRQKSGRILGPFVQSELILKMIQNEFGDEDECQNFPGGPWQPIKSFTELEIEASKVRIKEEEKFDPTQVVEPSKTSQTQVSIGEAPKEFRVTKPADGDLVDYAELEKKYQEKIKIKEPPSPEDKTVIVHAPQKVKSDDKTVFAPKKEKTDLVFEKSTVRPEITPLDDQTKSLMIKRDGPAHEKIDPSDATRVVSITESLPQITQDIAEAEKEIQKRLEEEELIKAAPKKKKKSAVVAKKKGMTPIVALAFLVVVWFVLFDDEEESEKINPRYLVISFPGIEKVENASLSAELFQKGLETYSIGSYENKLLAADYFKKSLSQKFDENKAYGHLILTYGELLSNVKDKELSSSELFKMTQISKSRILTDINVALGTALLYDEIGRSSAAIKIMDEFILVNKKTTPKFYAKFLELLLKNGRLEDARKIFEKLLEVNPRTEEIYLSMAIFHRMDEKQDEAEALLSEAVSRYPKSVRLRLEYAEVLLAKGELKKLEENLVLIKKLKAENSPTFYARFLEYQGMLLAALGKTDVAAKMFKMSLRISESARLRSKLAMLDITGGTNAETLIRESKVLQLIKETLAAQKEEKWDLAFRYAIEAVDLLPDHIEAQLLLGDLQIKRGYLQAAIDRISNLQRKFLTSADVNFKLIEAYIYAQKFKDAQKIINTVAATELKNSAKYASLMALFYRRSGNFVLSIKWFQDAVNRNPLNDNNYYLMASTFLEYRRYKEAKNMISRAISLDPNNVDYHILYAKILYELESVETAVGYLRKILEGSPDNPKIMADIAIYYFKSGQIKYFEMYRDQVMRAPKKNEEFYKFLMELSKLEEKHDDYVKYARELLIANPGDIDTRMSLAVYLFEQKRYSEARTEFDQLSSMLSSLPKVNYYLATIFYLEKKLEKALEFADKEITENPDIENGYLIKGKIYMAQNKVSEGVRLLEKAVSLNGSSVDSLIGLADVRFGQNNYEQARELYFRALKIESSNAHIHRQMGYIYRAIGQSRLAIESFKVYLDLAPLADDRGQIETLMNTLR